MRFVLVLCSYKDKFCSFIGFICFVIFTGTLSFCVFGLQQSIMEESGSVHSWNFTTITVGQKLSFIHRYHQFGRCLEPQELFLFHLQILFGRRALGTSSNYGFYVFSFIGGHTAWWRANREKFGRTNLCLFF